MLSYNTIQLSLRKRFNWTRSFPFRDTGKVRKVEQPWLFLSLPCVARLWRSLGRLSQAPRLVPDFTQAMDVIGHNRWRAHNCGHRGSFDLEISATWPRSIGWHEKSSCIKCKITLADYHRTVVKNSIILKISLLLQGCFFFFLWAGLSLNYSLSLYFKFF